MKMCPNNNQSVDQVIYPHFTIEFYTESTFTSSLYGPNIRNTAKAKHLAEHLLPKCVKHAYVQSSVGIRPLRHVTTLFAQPSNDRLFVKIHSERGRLASD